MRDTVVRLRRIALLLAVALLVGIAGRAGIVAAQGIPEVTIKAMDYAFEAPASIPAGVTSFVLENVGKELHHAQIARLQDGKTIDDLQAALRGGDEGAIFALLEFTGGNGIIVPGTRSVKTTVNLREGSYVLMCFVSSPDGVPHFAKGMIKPMQVTAPGQAAAAPTTNGTIVLKDFQIVLPNNIQGGSQTWLLENQGPQPHEMNLLKLAPGKTLADVLNAGESGPPPAAFLGGMQALNRGNSAWLTADLTPGTYVGICFIPDPATGKSHAELGMVAQFQIGGGGGQMPLPSTGEAPVPAELPDTGANSARSVLALICAMLLLSVGMVLRRRAA